VHSQIAGTSIWVSLDEIARRTVEAWANGATEVCMQDGIHPAFTGQTYLGICRKPAREVGHSQKTTPMALDLETTAQCGRQAIARGVELKAPGSPDTPVSQKSPLLEQDTQTGAPTGSAGKMKADRRCDSSSKSRHPPLSAASPFPSRRAQLDARGQWPLGPCGKRQLWRAAECRNRIPHDMANACSISR